MTDPRFSILTLLLLPLMAIWLSTSAALAQVTVFAAASTKTALDDVAARFTAETGKPVILSYGGSSALARQIQLQQDGLIDANSRVDLLTNQLVLVAHGADAPQLDLATTNLAQLLGERWLAMALVDAVPAGIYGKTALTALGQWADLSPRVAQSANVRAALALVATGEAAFGVVYATDAAAEEAVSVVASFPMDSHAPIVYPLAMVATSTNSSAPDFLAYLKHDDSKKIFVRHGFGVAGK